MELLQNPNIIYLLIVGGLAVGVLALASPGTGLLELVSISLLVGAGILVTLAGLPVNLWAMGIIIIGAALFALSVRRARPNLLLLISIILLALGSTYIFTGKTWWIPGVEPLLAVVVSVALGGFFWVAARKVIEAEAARPRHDLSALIGASGEAKSAINGEGSVYVDGELWTARSSTPIPEGAQVRVRAREGFVLVVEPLAAPTEAAEAGTKA
jgi:membrane-bound serine protease (ClpP class)